jgi:hypothetical protein
MAWLFVAVQQTVLQFVDVGVPHMLSWCCIAVEKIVLHDQPPGSHEKQETDNGSISSIWWHMAKFPQLHSLQLSRRLTTDSKPRLWRALAAALLGNLHKF